MKGKPSRAKFWFLLHSWLAMPIWAFVFFVCLTGTLATVSQEINWLVDPAFRANKPSAEAQAIGFDGALAALHKSDPAADVQWMMQTEDYFAIQARVTYPDASSATLYVNPYSGAIQGKAPEMSLRGFLRALHGWLLIPFKGGTSIGWYLVSALSIPLLGSLITGLIVYKKFWRGFFKFRIRFSQGARVAWGDFHRLAGVWSLWFIGVIAITAFWLLIQAVMWTARVSISTAGPPVMVAREEVPVVQPGQPVPRIALSEAMQVSREHMPAGFTPKYVGIPSNAYSHVRVWGRSGSWPLLYEWTSVNPYTGKVEDSRKLSDRSKLELVAESMRPLHAGDFGGLWVKLIWAFFGLLLSMMVLSGMLIWTKRTAQATAALRKKRAQLAGTPDELADELAVQEGGQ